MEQGRTPPLPSSFAGRTSGLLQQQPLIRPFAAVGPLLAQIQRQQCGRCACNPSSTSTFGDRIQIGYALSIRGLRDGRHALWDSRPHALAHLSAPDDLWHGELPAFEPSNEAVEFEALADTEFVLGSAAPHEHALILGYYSVHTSPDALRNGEAHILSIKGRLIQREPSGLNQPKLICGAFPRKRHGSNHVDECGRL